jgi:hypothetical protein
VRIKTPAASQRRWGLFNSTKATIRPKQPFDQSNHRLLELLAQRADNEMVRRRAMNLVSIQIS